jgi:hypothetical protein
MLHLAIGWAEKLTFYHPAAFFYVFQVSFCTGFPPLEMIVGVISHCVTFSFDPCKYFRVSLNVLTNTKESGFHLISIQDVQDDRGSIRIWPVVKAQVEIITSTRYLPVEALTTQ